MGERGFINARTSAQKGLTLVELLVVLAILAFAAFVVVLNAPPMRPPAQEAAERFAARIRSALDTAVIDGAAYRLEAQPSEYRIVRYDGTAWTPVFRENLASGRKDVLLRAELAEAAVSNALALNGEAAAGRNGKKETFEIPLDPFAGGPAVNVHFESRRGDWTVAMTQDGTLSVIQQ